MKGILDSRLPAPPRSIADPGAGVGAFTTSALSWWKDTSVYAVDVNLVTLGLLATRPDIGKEAACNLHVRQEDFLSWLGSSWLALRGPRLILGNPPYTRHQQLTREQKTLAQQSAGDISPDLRAGLSTYFLAAGLKALQPQDSLCLLLPVNWLEADYAKSVRKYLWNITKRRVELHLFPNHLEVFPGAQVAAMVVFVGPACPEAQPMAVYQVAGHAADGFTASRGALVDRNGPPPPAFTIPTFSQRSAKPETRQLTVPLAQLVSIRRGVATGANRFFLRTAAEKDQLPEGVCVQAVSRLRDLPAHSLGVAEHDKLGNDGVRCWLLYLAEQHTESPMVKKLLQEGEAQKIHERHLCKIRSPWYALEKIVTPDLLIGPMGKDRFRIVINDVGAIPTNTLYGLRLRDSSDTESIRRLAQWMSSEQGQDALRTVARQHGDGLLKLEPGPLGTVPVPAKVLNGHAPRAEDH
ncbi:Eco57I restriction-modification methylase domain-containing protein [Actinacidiphila oryziradicis]